MSMYGWKQPGAVGQAWAVAKCTACGRAAVVPESMDALEAALSLRQREGWDECAMVCAYCAAKHTVKERRLIDYAVMHGDAVRQHWQRELAREREKVARLAEGRW